MPWANGEHKGQRCTVQHFKAAFKGQVRNAAQPLVGGHAVAVRHGVWSGRFLVCRRGAVPCMLLSLPECAV